LWTVRLRTARFRYRRPLSQALVEEPEKLDGVSQHQAG